MLMIMSDMIPINSYDWCKHDEYGTYYCIDIKMR